MQVLKSYHFNAENTAVIAYRTRLGFAVVAGDLIGDQRRFRELGAGFRSHVSHPRLAHHGAGVQSASAGALA